jgi:hypothetical protein
MYSTKLKLESQNSTQCAEYTVRGVVEELRDKFWDSSLKYCRQSAASPKYNYDISLLISVNKQKLKSVLTAEGKKIFSLSQVPPSKKM